MNPNPIIIMGMHRSGTSLLTRILEEFGVFMGKNQDVNSEAAFFQDLNRWIFKQLGGRWDHPPRMEDLLQNEKIYRLIIEYLQESVKGPKTIKYLGFKKYLLNTFTQMGDGFKWGWKDPRNVFTLPIWLEIFPGARIIYIERHGVDVARSLMKRNQNTGRKAKERFKKHRSLYSLYSKKTGFMNSIRCSSLDGGFSLWEEYVKEAHSNLSKIEGVAVLNIKYEELLTNPELVLHRISKFIGLEITKRVRDQAESIQQMKAYSFKNDPDLKAFREKVSDRMLNY